ncbi:MAG TPA: hypothetical protein VF221_00645 [Chloroflexota bacterium]
MRTSSGWEARALVRSLTSVLAFFVFGSVAAASGSVTDLGRPTNAIPLYRALGSFRHIGTNLRIHGTPELLFVGTAQDEYSTAERWPVVKALDQFGTFAGVRVAAGTPCTADRESRVTCLPPADRTLATFDWQHARYTSRYLVFVYRELIDGNGRVRQPLSPLELSLVKRYAALPGYSSWHDTVWQTAENAQESSSRHFPLLLVDGYLETGAEVAIPGDLSEKSGDHALSFATVQDSLRTGKPIGQTPGTLIPDFNAEANIITALICHADGKKPASVCGRPAIKAILKHVK